MVLAVFLFSSCKKVAEDNQQLNNQQFNAPNLAPIAQAGTDISIVLPENEIFLNGGYYDAERNVKTIEWTKLSGPDSFSIENRNELNTRVSNLHEGVYQFELVVIDHLDEIGKDIVTITVKPASTIEIQNGEVIYRNLNWTFPWYAALELENIYTYVPTGKTVKVFVKRDSQIDWEEVPLVSYAGTATPFEYFIEDRPDGGGMYNYGSLYVFFYGNDTDDTPDVKVQF